MAYLQLNSTRLKEEYCNKPEDTKLYDVQPLYCNEYIPRERKIKY